jgi:SHS2 domain-containing protein
MAGIILRTMLKYKLIDHTADIGIEVYGRELKELFQNAGYALFDIICQAQAIKVKDEVDICSEGSDVEELIVNWLSELLYRHSVDGWLFCNFSIHELNQTNVRSTAMGERFNPKRHQIIREVKAITYHQLTVRKDNDMWYSRVIFDI